MTGSSSLTRPASGNPKKVTLVYGGVTCVLLAAIYLSSWCWQSQNVRGIPNLTIRDNCLALWTLSGVLLALSQIAFIVVALRMKPDASSSGHVIVERSTDRKRAVVAKILILVFAALILVAIAGFVLVLSTMPS